MKSCVFAFIIVGFFCLFSCKEKVRYEIIEVPSLSLNDLYSASVIHKFILEHANNKSIANSYFEKASKLYENNPSKAIYFVQRALTIFPKKSYYETLGHYFLEQKKYEEARILFQFLVEKYVDNGNSSYVFDKPDKELVLNYYISKILCGIYMDSYEINFYSKETGVLVSEYKDMLLNSSVLGVVKDSWMYKNISFLFLENGLTNEYLKSVENFNDILASIPEIRKSPFEINEEVVSAVRKNLDEFEEGDMSYNYNLPNVHGAELYTIESQLKNKIPSSDFYFVPNFTHKIHFSPDCIGVVYSKDSSVSGCPVEMREVIHNLVLFNHLGQLQDHLRLAWQIGEKMALVEVGTYGEIKQAVYKRNWESPYDKSNEDNHYEGKEYLDSHNYQIDLKSCKIMSEMVQEHEASPDDL